MKDRAIYTGNQFEGFKGAFLHYGMTGTVVWWGHELCKFVADGDNRGWYLFPREVYTPKPR